MLIWDYSNPCRPFPTVQFDAGVDGFFMVELLHSPKAVSLHFMAFIHIIRILFVTILDFTVAAANDFVSYDYHESSINQSSIFVLLSNFLL